ncbi:MAG: NUDIX domain-containing protein [Burkholderiales bacterium]|nr:NUDIX domain-containing protein [Burkholderiales bacterium]
MTCPDPVCGYVHWDNPVPVVAAIVEHEGRVVLARNRGWPEHMYGLITGFLERGESPQQGVAREVKEELDLDTVASALVGVYPFERKNELIIAYHVEAAGAIRLNEELVDYRTIVPERLRPWKFGTGLALADWLRARGIAVDFV